MPDTTQDASLYDSLKRVPETARAAFENGRLAMVSHAGYAPRRVLIDASGEARLAANLVASVIGRESTHPIVVQTDRKLPAWVEADDVVIAASLTGTASHCVALLSEAADRGCGIAVAAGGGHLRDMADAQKYPLVDLTGSASTGVRAFSALFFGLAGLTAAAALPGAGRAFGADAEAATVLLEALRDAYGPAAPTLANPARMVAEALQGIRPVFYGTDGVASDVAPVISQRTWQIGAVASTVGIVAPAGDNTAPHPEGDAAVLLSGADSPPDAANALLSHWRGESLHEITLSGNTALEQAWSAIMLFDWAAFYMAV